MYVANVMYCPINTAEKRMTEGLQKIKAVLLPIQGEVGGIPKSVISVTLHEAGLAEHAEEWLSQQGQYHCRGAGAGTTAAGPMLTLIMCP